MLNDFLSLLVEFQYIGKIIWSVLWILLVVILINVLNRIYYRAIKDNKTYHSVKKTSTYTLATLLLVILLFLWMDSSDNLATYAGLLSAGIAISLKELFSNIAGWLFILSRKPFKIGDRILISDQKGDVIDIRIFQFSLMEVSSNEMGEQSTGRIVDVPNYYILVHPLLNYTKGFEYIWNEVQILLTFESDWRLAKSILNQMIHSKNFENIADVDSQIKNAAKRYSIHYSNLTPIVYTNVKESGVELTIRYLCAPKKKRHTVNAIWEEVLTMVEDHEAIGLAYPTRRVLNY